MSFPFNFGIPAANNNPSDDQPIMQQNNMSSFGILNVDHVTYGLTNAGTHKTVTFEGSSLNPTLPSDYYQLLPQQFPPLPASGQYIETYIENQPSSGSPIMGYLPFVKCIGAYNRVVAAYPQTLTPITDSLNTNIASVIQSSTNAVSVTFTTPLIYNTYMIVLDAASGLGISAITARTTTGFSVFFSGSVASSPLFQFMVI